MSHDDLQGLLPAYAAGDLDVPAARAVREHLASGCGVCLTEMFRHPVGHPVAEPERKGPARWLTAVVLLGALAVPCALAGWRIVVLRRHARALHESLERVELQLAEATAARATIADRLARLEGDVRVLRTAARAERARAEQAEEAKAALRRDLDDAQSRLDDAQSRLDALTHDLTSNRQELDRRLPTRDDEFAARALARAPGVRPFALEPVEPFRDVRGQAFWRPGRNELLLHATHLPPVPASQRYRVRMELDDGSVASGPAFVPDARGEVAIPVPLSGVTRRVRELGVVLEPAGRPVLTGQAAPPPG